MSRGIASTSTAATDVSAHQRDCVVTIVSKAEATIENGHDAEHGHKDRSCWPRSKQAPPYEIKRHQVESLPEGYPRLAAYMASDANYMVYRRYGYLHSRVLLELQWRIEELQDELTSLDRMASRESAARLRHRALDVSTDRVAADPLTPRSRTTVLCEIKDALLDYGELLRSHRDLSTCNEPSSRDYGSIRNYFETSRPLIDGEARWIRWRSDLVTLRKKRDTEGFDGLVEATLLKFNCRPVRFLFETEEERWKSSNDKIQYFSEKRIATLTTLIVTTVAMGLLVVPIYLLYRVTEGGKRGEQVGDNPQSPLDALVILIVSTLVFCVLMSILTKASRQELFAATAAYCAVLVVFVGNFVGDG